MPADPFAIVADLGQMAGVALIVLAFATFVGVAVVFGSSQVKRANRAWSQVGSQMELDFHEASFWSRPQLYGHLQGFPVEVDTYRVRQGKHSHTYTRVRIRYESLGMGLSLRREGFVQVVTKWFGLEQDIELGDAAFDSEVIVAGSDPAQLRQLLTPARRMRIRRFFNNYPRALIEDDLITCSVSGLLRNDDQLRQMIGSTQSIAWHLAGERKSDQYLDQALQAQERGDTQAALKLIRSTSSPTRTGEPVVAQLVNEEPVDAELIEEKLIEGELLTLAGKTDEAHRLFQEARQIAPYDEEIAEWAEQPTAGPKSDVSEANPNLSEPVPEATQPQLEIVDLCKQLFAGSSTSYQINHFFDKHYAGAAVRWTGQLNRAEKYSYDFIFGSEPGCKAVVVIHQLETALYGDRTVSAIVQLPPEADDQLRGKTATEITFTGKLHKVDSLLRNFYLVEGELV